MDKVLGSPDEAIADIPDGATIAISGFSMVQSFPSSLIVALRDKGAKGLCIVCNSLGAPGEVRGNILAESGQISRLITAFTARPGLATASSTQIAEGAITYELVPQGVLVERMRAAGAGIPAFYSPTGVGTLIAENKEQRSFGGRNYILETALPVDFALLRGAIADRSGNVKFRGSTQNFNPSFAKAARVAIAEVDEIVEVGELSPEEIHLPGIFVSRVVRSTVKVDPSVRSISARPLREAERRTYFDKPAWSRREMAERVAALIPEHSYVNLGTGMPGLVSECLVGRDVTVHAENGILGFGKIVQGVEIDPDVYNAGGANVSALPGTAYFDSVTSFEIARGGRLDAIVLGAYQVDGEGNLANWSTPEMVGGGIGGAMDLVASRRNVIVVMEHRDSKDSAKLVGHCTYPLTGEACVDVVVTDLAVMRRKSEGFEIEEVAPGFSPDEVRLLSEAALSISPGLVLH